MVFTEIRFGQKTVRIPIGASSKTSLGYAMLEHPCSLSQTPLQTLGSIQATSSEKTTQKI